MKDALIMKPASTAERRNRVSNALKKKSKQLKPKDYENRFAYMDIQKRKALAENCFGEVFKSI
jgi:hypothetical protein